MPTSGSISSSGENNFDFFRSGTGATTPDGTTDTTEDISHAGRVGVGVANPTLIESTLDVDGSIGGGVQLAVAGGAAPGTLILDALYVQANPAAPGHVQLPAGSPDGRVIYVQNYGTSTLQVNNNGALQIFPIDQAVSVTNVVLPAKTQAMFICNGAGWIGPAFQGPVNSRRVFSATGVTDGSGNVTFNFGTAFPVTPVVSVAFQGAASASPVDYRITAVSTTSVTVNVRQSLATVVALIGLTILAASVPLSGATIHVIAVAPGTV